MYLNILAKYVLHFNLFTILFSVKKEPDVELGYIVKIKIIHDIIFNK